MLHLQLRTRILVLSLVLSLAGSAIGVEAAAGHPTFAVAAYLIALYLLVKQIRQIAQRDG